MTINCPVCGGRTGVLHNYSDGESMYRSRKCKECGHVFYTTEEELVSSKKYFLEMEHVESVEKYYRRKYGAIAVESQNKVKGKTDGN